MAMLMPAVRPMAATAEMARLEPVETPRVEITSVATRLSALFLPETQSPIRLSRVRLVAMGPVAMPLLAILLAAAVPAERPLAGPHWAVIRPVARPTVGRTRAVLVAVALVVLESVVLAPVVLVERPRAELQLLEAAVQVVMPVTVVTPCPVWPKGMMAPAHRLSKS